MFFYRFVVRNIDLFWIGMREFLLSRKIKNIIETNNIIPEAARYI